MATAPSRHFRIEALAPGVHAAIATPDGFGLCNAGIVDLGGETVVFDTMLTPMAGRDLARAAELITGRRPGWAVNSHWHGDHIWGNSAFVASHIASSRRARTNILKRSRSQFENDRRVMRRELPTIDGPNSPYPEAERTLLQSWYTGVLRTPRSHRIVPPDVTFDECLVLEGSRRSVQLWTYGGGHSPSDVFAYLPEERIVFAGDLAIRGFHPSVGDGWPVRWISILRRMEKLNVRTVLPGHGRPGPGGILSETRAYLQKLDRIARAGVRHRTSTRELANTAMPPRWREWKFSFFFPSNIARAHRLVRAERTRPPS